MNRLFLGIATPVFWLVLTGFSGSAAGAENSLPRRYALIVGNNESLDANTPSLLFADDDAIRYRDLFVLLGAQASMLTVLDPETQKRFPGLGETTEPPTKTNLLKEFETMRKEMAELKSLGVETEFYFVFSGHGGVDKNKNGYIHLLDGPFYRSEFYAQIIEPAESTYTHLIIDACNSYFFVHRRGDGWKNDQADMETTPWVRNFIEKNLLSNHPRVGAILSTSGPFESHEWSRYEAGVFSHEIRSAMLGAADVNNDGKVEYGEVAAFVAAANLNITNPEARLDVSITPPTMNTRYPLVDFRRSPARFAVVKKEDALKGFIVSEGGIRWADFNKTDEQALYVALAPSQEYYLVRGDGKETLISKESGELVEVSQLAYQEPPTGIRGRLADAFHRNLFTTAFGINFARGYLASMGYPELALRQGTFLENEVDVEGPTASLAVGFGMTGAMPSFSGVAAGVDLQGRIWLGEHWFLSSRLGWSVSNDKSNKEPETVHIGIIQLGLGATLFRIWNVDVRSELLAGTLLLFRNITNETDSDSTQGVLVSLRAIIEIDVGEGQFLGFTPGLDTRIIRQFQGGLDYELSPVIGIQLGTVW